MACSMFDEGMNFLRLCYYFTSGVLIAMGLHMLYQLRLTYGFDYILILALATFGTDTGAYFTGMCLGRHKLNPRLSPKKTIEGSIGGIILGTVLSGAYGAYIQIDMPIIWLIIMCFILTMTSQIGTFKKTYGDALLGNFAEIITSSKKIVSNAEGIPLNRDVLVSEHGCKKGTVYFSAVSSHSLEPSNTCDVTLKFSADDLF